MQANKLHCGEKWGSILSGIGLSGSDRDVRVSNLLDTCKVAVVSNNDVENFGIQQRIHSQTRLIVDPIHS